MLYHLIYTSAVTEKFTDECFVKLLLHARDSNSKNKLTGILLYTSGNFIQYIEGAKESILGLLEKLKLDGRHYNIDVIARGEITNRSFCDWSMQYHTFPKGELEQMIGCQQIAQSPEAIKRTVKLVKLFKPACVRG